MQTLLPIKGSKQSWTILVIFHRWREELFFRLRKKNVKQRCLPSNNSGSILVSAVFILQNAACIWWILRMHDIFYAALQRTGFQWDLWKSATKDIRADSWYYYYYSCGRKDFRNYRIHCEWCTAQGSSEPLVYLILALLFVDQKLSLWIF